MLTLVTWALPVLGATLIITCSSLLKPMRRTLQGVPAIGRLVSCPMCAGFWVGVCASCLGHTLIGVGHPSRSLLTLAPTAWIWLGVFADGCSAAFICWTAHVVLCGLGQGKLLSTDRT